MHFLHCEDLKQSCSKNVSLLEAFGDLGGMCVSISLSVCFSFFFFVVLRIEPSASGMSGKYPGSHVWFLMVHRVGLKYRLQGSRDSLVGY